MNDTFQTLQTNQPPTAAQYKVGKAAYLTTDEPLSMWSVELSSKVTLAYPYHAISRIDYVVDDQSGETMMITLGKNMVVVGGRGLTPIYDAVRRHKLDKLKAGGESDNGPRVTELSLAEVDDGDA